MCSGPLERTKSLETWIIVRCMFSFNSYYPSFFRGKGHFKANFRPVQNRSPPDMFCSFLTERACEHFGSKCGAFVLRGAPAAGNRGENHHGGAGRSFTELRLSSSASSAVVTANMREKKRKRNKTKGGEECFLHQM